MDLDDIKAHLDRIFAAGTRTSSREQAAGLREALIEFKVGIGQLTEALTRAERELEVARKEAADYARRGQLATDIDDQETARIAGEFTAKARERVDLLERKVIVMRDELAMAQRDYEETKQRFQFPGDPVIVDQRAKEAAVEAQLEHLKKKLGERK